MSSWATLKAFVALVSASLIIISSGGGRPFPALADEPDPPPVDEAPPGIELTNLRTADTRTFATCDGTYVTQFFTEPVFYQPDGSSDWAPIDTSFAAVSRGSTKAAVDASPAQLDLAAADATGGFLTLSGDGHTISFGLPPGTSAGRAGTQPVVKEDGAYVEYADFLPGGIGLRVFPHSDGFKSFLVVYQKPTTNSFTLAVDAPGLSLAPDAELAGSFAFTDRAGNIVGRIPRPYLLDSSEVEGRGGGLYSEAVSQSAVLQPDGSYLLTLTVEPAFLESAVYPVYVDPTTTDFPTPNTTAQDTFASSKYPTSNFNTYQRPDSPYYYEMWHGKEPGTSYYNEVYIRFKELRATLGTVKIDDARLEIYPYWQYYHYAGRPTWIKRVTSDWSGGSLTWNDRPAVADEDDGPYLTEEGEWSHIDLTAFVQDVVNDEWENNGVMLHANDTGQGNWKRFVSRNDTHTPDYKPHLSVTWSPFVPFAVAPAGTPSASRTLTWGHDPVAADTASYQVELATSASYGGTIIASSGTISGTATSWTVPGGVSLTSNTTYHWHVRAKYGVNTSWSSWSDDVSFTYRTNLPVAWIDWPDYDWAYERDLEWAYDDGDGDTGTNTAQAQYQVQVATSDTFSSTIADSGVVSSSTARSWAIPGGVSLTDGNTYYWRVKVSDGTTWSEWAWTEFGWTTEIETTGIDAEATSMDGLSSEELGYVPTLGAPFSCTNEADIDCLGEPPASRDLRDSGLTIFHQKRDNWCVPAILQTMLNYLIQDNPLYINDPPAFRDLQRRLRNLLLAVQDDRIADFYDGTYTPDGLFGRNGIDAYIGLDALNAELQKEQLARYRLGMPTSASALVDLVTNDVGRRRRPVFVEVDIRKPEWLWQSHAGSPKPWTHATAVIGYASGGSAVDLADPFKKNGCTSANQQGLLKDTSGYSYSSSDNYGCVWEPLSASQLYAAAYWPQDDPEYKPVWY